MTQLATYSVTQSAPFNTFLTVGTFNFAVAIIDPPGAIPDLLEENQEELTDNGVNGRRWRRLNKQFTPFTLSTVADSTSYDTGVTMARAYRAAVGSVGTLSVTLDGTAYTWRNVKVTRVIPDLRKGVLVGNGASSGSAIIIRARWSMVCADTSKQGNS